MTSKYSDYSKRNILTAAILLIGFVAIYNWFITPQTQYLAAAQKYHDTMDTREKIGRLITTQLKLRRQKLDELTQKFESEKQVFFKIEQAKSFLSGIQSIAEKNGCQVVNLRLSPSREITVKDNNSIEIYQYQADMSLLGGYGNIVKFLNTIQNKPAKVWIDTISVSMKQAATSGYLSCNITLSIYTLKVKENADYVENKQI
ncbi:MAG: type 4a pilus biogenesis protein PilO [Planctomycetes bacterium]|nr:type 4a pilus biogenesis protein PilO [Planctomycetota bacterium]MBU1518431.1 type 4a pilus biogenesis protein PilO [Planctomycetota bacterium]MBU2457804.1 type 4a pilus biogenesis protein PilO [Planctomycetota bacterium]MBU2597156.1 type 4a pilus biogenesis protein PilO [Planctomycetota bacterium]